MKVTTFSARYPTKRRFRGSNWGKNQTKKTQARHETTHAIYELWQPSWNLMHVRIKISISDGSESQPGTRSIGVLWIDTSIRKDTAWHSCGCSNFLLSFFWMVFLFSSRFVLKLKTKKQLHFIRSIIGYSFEFL